jgi:glycosyltransferase involved in cell wall biosynthesis
MAIKVYISTNKFKGGPEIFRSRLISALNKYDDIKVIKDVNDKFDIGLEFIRKTQKYKQPYILRAGSCYYFNKYKPWNNKPIAKSITESSYSIFQSKFAYKLCNRVLRLESRNLIKNGYSIINNGVDLSYIDMVEPDKSIEQGSIVACSRWDANKRIKSMLKGFLNSGVKRHFYIIGDYGISNRKKDLNSLKKKYNSKYIHILGVRSNEEVISIMKACDYQIHLSFIDICPNIVIEGLACGLNVLCTNLGGTPELVGKNGVILDVDKFWDTRYLKKRIEDLDNLKSSVVARGICKLMMVKKTPNVSKFDINVIAKKYLNIVKKIVR